MIVLRLSFALTTAGEIKSKDIAMAIKEREKRGIIKILFGILRVR
jgi:hypothetical protein